MYLSVRLSRQRNLAVLQDMLSDVLVVRLVQDVISDVPVCTAGTRYDV